MAVESARESRHKNRDRQVTPGVRAGLLVLALVVLVAISWAYTGRPIPEDPAQILLFQSSLLLVVLGTLVLERYFTGPGDALVNALGALLTILAYRNSENAALWGMLVLYLCLVLVAAFVALILQRGRGEPAGKAWVVRIQSACYQISSVLGRARVVFSAVFLVSAIFFVQDQQALTTALLLFWAVYVAMWPLGVPDLLSRLGRPTVTRDSVGSLVRIDSPNLARVALRDGVVWPAKPTESLVVTTHDGITRWGIPLMSESRADGVWGTVLLASSSCDYESRGVPGTVQLPVVDDGAPTVEQLVRATTEGAGSEVLGLVREGSTSRRLRVELLPRAVTALGQIVGVVTGSDPVYYQVVEGETSEEGFGTLQYGSHIATAAPVGMRTSDGRFEPADWVPLINSPVFRLDDCLPETRVDPHQFTLGNVPGTTIAVTGDFLGQLETHTAILGMTGSGKTELAFDLVRHAAQNGVKVLCLDLTSQYAPRLADLAPTELSISDDKATQLGEKLFDVETGSYGAGAEKKILARFADAIRDEVDDRLRKFLQSDTEHVGLIELREIANTKATLWITDMYLSTLLKLAKDGISQSKVLVVIEEAHTVMPEASFAGLGDFESKGTIAKITQLALQGRKYGVGLLVLAQRTATVSKSVLTQCNTVVSFACIDDTSINFLRNVYGDAVAEGVPNLRRLRAVAHGPWINSGLPIAFDVPFNESKAQRLDWASQRAGAKPMSVHQTARSGSGANRPLVPAPQDAGDAAEPPF